MMRRVSVIMAAAAATVLLVACGNESRSRRGTVDDAQQCADARADAADRRIRRHCRRIRSSRRRPTWPSHLGVDPAQVTVVSSDDVTWRDGSLGCPEPGMRYTQALIPGTRTILEVAGKQYHYHSGGHRAPFLCENPQPPVGG